MNLSDAQEFCRQYTRQHYENFTVASFLLPRQIRQAFYPVYSFCRWADDLGDESPDNQTALAALDDWNSQLDDCYQGRADHPIFIALKPIADEYSIPKSLFADLIAAFRLDQTKKECDSREELLDYCKLSANPVGRIVLHLAKTTDEESLVLSDKICTGLQLANHWQDVARDKRRATSGGQSDSRRYVPLSDMLSCGYSLEDFQNEVYNPAFVKTMSRLCDWADSFFTDGRPLVNRVPRSFQTDIKLFIMGGQKIVEEIRRVDYNVWSNRPTISRWSKFRLLLKALLG
ncbi:MAG: squalene synthase HpnC [Thermoguttaceae bacterium]|nr:squalene synthase HpnC [Thermoguttaceae bacterium]